MKSFNLNFQKTKPTKVKDIVYENSVTLKFSHDCLNNLFGDGIQEGHTFQITGYRGVGKTTLLLQLLEDISKNYPTLFITNEESTKQIARRCERLSVKNAEVVFQNNIHEILEIAKDYKLIVIDSFQGIYGEKMKEKDIIAALVNFGKTHNISVGIVAHMTKDKKEKGVTEVAHLVDQCIKISHAVPEMFGMEGNVVIVHTDKNREGKAGYMVFENGDSGYDFNNPWDEELVENLDPDCFRKV